MRIVFIACLFIMAFGRSAAQEVAPPAAAPATEQARADTARVQSDEQLKETMATVGLTEMPGLHQWEREKSAKVAVISSMLLPGLGQAYNGRKWKAAILLGFFTFYAGTGWVEHKKSVELLDTRDSFPANSPPWNVADQFYQFHKDNANDYLWWAGAIWFIGLLDAFVDAHLFDIRAVDPGVFEGSGGKKYVGLSYGL